MIIFDASAVVSAALKEESIPGQALLWADRNEVFALSEPVHHEISGVLDRQRFALSISPERKRTVMGVIRDRASWWSPTLQVTDCRDAKDNKYLELALASQAKIIVSGDNDLLILDPWRGVRILRPAEYLSRTTSPP